MAMKINDLIKQLQKASKQHGNLPITTWDGYVGEVKIEPTVDGVSYPIDVNDINEISIEILTEYE